MQILLQPVQQRAKAPLWVHPRGDPRHRQRKQSRYSHPSLLPESPSCRKTFTGSFTIHMRLSAASQTNKSDLTIQACPSTPKT